LKGIKGGVMRGGGGKGSAASEARSGGAEKSRPRSVGAVEKTKLTSGPHVSAGG
jgi:hypothetical protein